MRVLLDASYAARAPHSGTGVYIERLAAALREREGIEIVTARQRRRLAPGAGNPLRSAANLLLDLLWLYAGLPRAASAAGADVVHHPLPTWSPRIRAAQVATIHDLAFERLPDAYPRAWRIYARRLYRRAARRCATVVCPSEATAADVRELLGADPLVAPHGDGQELPPVERAGEPEHLLYVGDEAPRKRLELLRAAAGEQGIALAEARGVPAERLAELHARAVALVHPSRAEGFGLTLVEAMKLGTPVLALRSAAAAEVCGDAALLVDEAELPAALRRMASDPELRERLSRAGRERAARFSWAESARLHERAYRLALEQP
jgi:glycosyltransferase involved in cell wall biosynthesis